jgi:hypothetical protein
MFSFKRCSLMYLFWKNVLILICQDVFNILRYLLCVRSLIVVANRGLQRCALMHVNKPANIIRERPHIHRFTNAVMHNHASAGSLDHRDWLVQLLCEELGNTVHAPIPAVCRHNPCVFFETINDFRRRTPPADSGGVAAMGAVGGPAAADIAGGNPEVGAAGGNAAVQAAMDPKAGAKTEGAGNYLKVKDTYFRICRYYLCLRTCLHAHS